MRKALIIAVHPDDETLGCGGTMLRLRAEGYEVNWGIVTSTKPEDGFSAERIATRHDEMARVAKMYDAVKWEMGFSSSRLEQYPTGDLVKAFSALIYDIEPELIFLPFHGDAHSDHGIVFRAAYSCTKVFRYPFVKEILVMETLSETDFAPATTGNVFVPHVFYDISPYLKQKLEIMKVFESEVGDPPFPRSLENMEALATLRGGQAGVRYAEAFMQLKQIR